MTAVLLALPHKLHHAEPPFADRRSHLSWAIERLVEFWAETGDDWAVGLIREFRADLTDDQIRDEATYLNALSNDIYILESDSARRWPEFDAMRAEYQNALTELATKRVPA